VTIALDVRDLVRHPGVTRRVAVREEIEGLGTELVRVPEGRPVHADLLLESLAEGILVSGQVAGIEVILCARCLKPGESDFTVHVEELFAPGATLEDDEYPISEDTIDLEPMIRDAVMLSVPFAPLCSPECLGLCERCGGDRNLGECGCGPVVDARWEALAELRLDDGDSMEDTEDEESWTQQG
jgi:uncharacterized protein